MQSFPRETRVLRTRASCDGTLRRLIHHSTHLWCDIVNLKNRKRFFKRACLLRAKRAVIDDEIQIKAAIAACLSALALRHLKSGKTTFKLFDYKKQPLQSLLFIE